MKSLSFMNPNLSCLTFVHGEQSLLKHQMTYAAMTVFL
jgi:hypothetical protein